MHHRAHGIAIQFHLLSRILWLNTPDRIFLLKQSTFSSWLDLRQLQKNSFYYMSTPKRGRPKKYFNEQCRRIYTNPDRVEIRKIPYDEFEQWYMDQLQECYYCALTQRESAILFESFPEATREGRRGRNLELDRKNPTISYGETLENLVLACYWCNNAKTNYFTADEFGSIGLSIGRVNRRRLEVIAAQKES